MHWSIPVDIFNQPWIISIITIFTYEISSLQESAERPSRPWRSTADKILRLRTTGAGSTSICSQTQGRTAKNCQFDFNGGQFEEVRRRVDGNETH